MPTMTHPATETETTSLLKLKISPLNDLFQSVEATIIEVPIKGQEALEDKHKPTSRPASHRIVTRDCLTSTLLGSFTFLLYHVVFCLAQASTITRPHATTSIIGPVAKMAALGILLASPVFVAFLGSDVPAIYPTSDLFLAPFLAELAVTIDETLYEENLQDDNVLFLATFCTVSSAGLLLSGVMCILAARVKLANLGSFLPYSVLCGFFSTIGVLMWTLAFSVDTGGKKAGAVFLSGDWQLIGASLLHHAPSFGIGVIMHVVGPKNPLYVILLVIISMVGAYLVMLITGTSFAEAQELGWFFTSADLASEVNESKIGFLAWGPPAPFGVINSIISRHVHWGAFRNCLPTVCALAFLYMMRCSLHAAALKKNIPNVTRKKPVDDSESSKPKSPVELQKILECGYGYCQLMASVSGGIAVAPAVAPALTLFKMGAEGVAPQYGSFALLAVFYLTDFQLVRYIPKPAFSCLLVLAFLDMTATWFVRSYKNTKQKWEWMVAPLIVVLTFSVGLLNAVFLGVALSTFIFVASFQHSGVVKYLGSGLALRSTIERGHKEAAWLDQNGDLIQILVLQNYLFFGNAQSLLSYITIMFDESNGDASQDLVVIPPAPLYIIMDFAIVSGMDTSAVDLLRETITLCKNHQCRLFLSGMSQTLRSNLLYAGIKTDGKTLYFQPDLELSLGKAEDGLLTNVFHVVEQDEHDAGMRRRARALSLADNGFLYALKKIDEQHGLNYTAELVKLEKYTKVVELKPDESLFGDEGESVAESDRGFFFIENGLMRVERNVIYRSRSALSLRTSFSATNLSQMRVDSNNSYASTGLMNAHSASVEINGHLHARATTIGRRDAMNKEARTSKRGVQNFRLARIGQGWVVGSIEGCSGMRNSGMHFAVTACRLHLLPFVQVKEIEKTDPALILSLFRLVSHLSARRQELTIEQLTQYMMIMNSPAHTSVTLTALQRKMIF